MPKDSGGRDRGGGGGAKGSGSGHGAGQSAGGASRGGEKHNGGSAGKGRGSDGSSGRGADRAGGHEGRGADRAGGHEGRSGDRSNSDRGSTRSEKPKTGSESPSQKRGDGARSSTAESNRSARGPSSLSLSSHTRSGSTPQQTRTSSVAGHSAATRTSQGYSVKQGESLSRQRATLNAIQSALASKQATKDRYGAQRTANEIQSKLQALGYDRARVQVRTGGYVEVVAERNGAVSAFKVGPGFQRSESYYARDSGSRNPIGGGGDISIGNDGRQNRGGNPDLGPRVDQGGGAVLANNVYDQRDFQHKTGESSKAPEGRGSQSSSNPSFGRYPTERQERGPSSPNEPSNTRLPVSNSPAWRPERPEHARSRDYSDEEERLRQYDKPLETPILDPIDFLSFEVSLFRPLFNLSKAALSSIPKLLAGAIIRAEEGNIPFQIEELLTKLGYSEGQVSLGKSRGQILIRAKDPRSAAARAYRQVVPRGVVSTGVRTEPVAYSLNTTLGSKVVIRSPNASKTARDFGERIFTVELHDLPGFKGGKWTLKFRPE
jgi:hypothetical protein